ncbi:MAG: carboxyvinyl-carboxyphosphonate phosphorylmutase [Alphaproteobacteria bacterium 64-6]|nr:MAG: carboxyvinyl-carboxyphosphonate phosphorylmutase [Alphaproteobacteria bacterium 64-6]
MATTATLKSMLRSGPMVIAPGAYDCLTARLVEQAGFPAVYMTGAGTSVSHGLPDYGLLTMTEMVANAGRMAATVGVPLISDADTGYGNELNVYRTVQSFERAGVSAIHIEDQVFPKRCGHLDGKELVSREDYAAKIRAAAAARRTADFLIIARTDARGVAGFDEAVARCNMALEAGADMAFFEAPQSVEEVAAVPRVVKGPCLFNNVLSGKTPAIPHLEIERMGYRLAIVPGMLMSSIIGLCDKLLAELKATGLTPATFSGGGPSVTFARVGAADWDQRRTAFRDAGPPKTGRDAAE